MKSYKRLESALEAQFFLFFGRKEQSSLEVTKMSVAFSSLPIISLSVLASPSPSKDELIALSNRLDEVFSTTGFAYVTDLPLTYTHDDVFGICDEFFGEGGLSMEEKMKLAKKTFVKKNNNTYRGFVIPSFIWQSSNHV